MLPGRRVTAASIQHAENPVPLVKRFVISFEEQKRISKLLSHLGDLPQPQDSLSRRRVLRTANYHEPRHAEGKAAGARLRISRPAPSRDEYFSALAEQVSVRRTQEFPKSAPPGREHKSAHDARRCPVQLAAN